MDEDWPSGTPHCPQNCWPSGFGWPLAQTPAKETPHCPQNFCSAELECPLGQFLVALTTHPFPRWPGVGSDAIF
jgi:hypothetical protein